MKKLVFIAAIFFAASSVSFAQIHSAKLTASGLTCSMCSKAILKSLQKVSFIQDVQPDIAASTYGITFRPGMAVSPDEIRKAVEHAGFSVAALQISANIPPMSVENDAHFSIGGLNIHFLDVPKKAISGEQTFTLIDKGFLPQKDYKRYSAYTKMPCYQTGIMAACCAKDAGIPAGRIYHVTL